jgi:hypothetical protein
MLNFQYNRYPYAWVMDSDERKTLFGGMISLIFVVAAVGTLIVAFIIGQLNDGNNPATGTNPTTNDQPFSEPNFDNFENDGLINGQR